MADEPTVLLRVEEGVAWITLNRPERLNAFAGTMRGDLHDAVAEAAETGGVRVLVITGAGRAFCAGADLEVTAELARRGAAEEFAALVLAGVRVVERLRAVRQPVIAAVNGAAAGAGASLALACDFRIASDRATFGVGFNRIGLHPDWGATYFLPRLVGPGRAAELVLTARTLDAAEAERLGIFERVVPAADFDAAVRALAAELAAKPPLALELAKRTLAGALDRSLEQVLQAERAAQLRCFASADAREGIAAFLEKRSPVFRGE
ncbi:MAG TPA: enoyl-CoA hydratase-related protein [Longimicrobiaceae bacterium]|nr:enoyl-CoA hydratase-related protein [Longimicrobiaceae bacterium]